MQRVNEFYATNIDSCESKLISVQKSFRNTANVRVVIALLIAASVYGALDFNMSVLWLSLALVACFFIMVQKSSKLEREASLLEKTLELNRNELAFLRGDKNVFDPGSALAPKDHLYALDLDIFGTRSLFQSVN